MDHTLFRELNDYVFQGKSLSNVVEDYNKNVNNNVYKEEEKIKNGKIFYDCLRHELHQIRKDEVELIQIIVEYLFANQNTEIEELAKFLEKELSATR